MKAIKRIDSSNAATINADAATMNGQDLSDSDNRSPYFQQD
jgi:hypothetical protein